MQESIPINTDIAVIYFFSTALSNSRDEVPKGASLPEKSSGYLKFWTERSFYEEKFLYMIHSFSII